MPIVSVPQSPELNTIAHIREHLKNRNKIVSLEARQIMGYNVFMLE